MIGLVIMITLLLLFSVQPSSGFIDLFGSVDIICIVHDFIYGTDEQIVLEYLNNLTTAEFVDKVEDYYDSLSPHRSDYVTMIDYAFAVKVVYAELIKLVATLTAEEAAKSNSMFNRSLIDLFYFFTELVSSARFWLYINTMVDYTARDRIVLDSLFLYDLQYDIFKYTHRFSKKYAETVIFYCFDIWELEEHLENLTSLTLPSGIIDSYFENSLVLFQQYGMVGVAFFCCLFTPFIC